MISVVCRQSRKWASVALVAALFLFLGAQTALADKKFKVSKVTIRKNASVSKYLKQGKKPGDLKELLKGIGDRKNWVLETSGERVISAYPEVDGHPGHVDGKDWKMYIERGKRTVDRLFLKKRKYTVTPSKKDPNVLNVEIFTSVFVQEDTH